VAQLVRVRRWISALLTAGVVQVLTAAPAAAQCVLCYTSAAGAGDRGIRTLQIGILILMIPTVSILAGLVWMVVRRGNSDPVPADGSETRPKWEEELASLGVPPEPGSLSPRV
jgi:hypothetical protein